MTHRKPPQDASRAATRDGAGETAVATPRRASGAAGGLPERGATYRVEIPGWWPALLNHFIYRHWTVMSRMKRRDRDTIALVMLSVPRATGRRRVALTLVLGPRQRQCDGDAPWKSLLDALTKCGALVDDSPEWVEVAPLRFERRAHKAAVIELTDLPPAADSRGAEKGGGR